MKAWIAGLAGAIMGYRRAGERRHLHPLGPLGRVDLHAEAGRRVQREPERAQSCRAADRAGGRLVQKYAVAAAGGTAPDASSTLIYTPAFAAAGQLEDLTDFAKCLPHFDALSKAHLSVSNLRRQDLTACRFSADASVLIWNKDPFESRSSTRKGSDHRPDPRRGQGRGARCLHIKGYFGQLRRLQRLHLHPADLGRRVATSSPTTAGPRRLDTPQMRDAIAFYRGMVRAKGCRRCRRPTRGLTSRGRRRQYLELTPSGSFAIPLRSTRSIPTCTTASALLPGKGTAGRPSPAAHLTSSSRRARRRSRRSRPSSVCLLARRPDAAFQQRGSLPVRNGLSPGNALKGLDPYPHRRGRDGRRGAPFSTVFNDPDQLGSHHHAGAPPSSDRGVGGAIEGQSTMRSIIDTALTRRRGAMRPLPTVPIFRTRSAMSATTNDTRTSGHRMRALPRSLGTTD